MPTYSFEGYADNTDLGAVTGWSRLTGNSLDINVDFDGKLDFTAPVSDAAYGAEQSNANHDFAVTYATFAEGVFFPCCVRITDANNFIGARLNGGNLQLFKRVTGTFTQLGSNVAVTGANGDTLKVTASGNTLNVYVNGVLKIGPITESAHNTVTKCGMVARSTAAANLIESTESTVASTGLTITSVTPSSFDSGIAGIVIAGAGFGASQGSSTVDIGGQAQTVTAWSDTSITMTSARGSNSMGAGQLKVTIR